MNLQNLDTNYIAELKMWGTYMNFVLTVPYHEKSNI